MALSKPRFTEVPYSSMYRSEDVDYAYFNAICENYIFGDETYLTASHILIQVRSYFPEKFLTFLGGNYSELAMRTVEGRKRKRSSPQSLLYKFDQLHINCRDVVSRISNLDNLRSGRVISISTPADEAIALGQSKLDQAVEDLQRYIETVMMPQLLVLNKVNADVYERYSYDSFRAAMLKPRRKFQDVALRFMGDFFYFLCYATPWERMSIIKIAVNIGKELLPTLPRLVAHCDFKPLDTYTYTEYCNLGLWLMLKYHDMYSTQWYNLSFSVEHEADFKHLKDYLEALPQPQDSPETRYIKLGLKYMNNSPFRNLPCNQVSHALAHMGEMSSLSTHCGIALAMGLHQRLGMTTETVTEGEGARKKTLEVLKAVSPIALLDEGIVKLIWNIVRDKIITQPIQHSKLTRVGKLDPKDQPLPAPPAALPKSDDAGSPSDPETEPYAESQDDGAVSPGTAWLNV